MRSVWSVIFQYTVVFRNYTISVSTAAVCKHIYVTIRLSAVQIQCCSKQIFCRSLTAGAGLSVLVEGVKHWIKMHTIKF